jgi:hypothetical protein
VHRSKSTDVDLGVGLVFSLGSRPKEIMQEINAGSLIRKRNSGDWLHRNSNHSADKLWINLNRLSSDHGLHNESSIILLDDDHVAIELLYQYGKGRVGIVIQILPFVFPEASEQWGVRQDPSDLCGEDSDPIGPATIACGAACQQLTLQFFA